MPSDVAITSTTTITGTTVVAIQGQAISTLTPTDGYVLTWNAGTSEWISSAPPAPLPALTQYIQTFNSNGTWTCPSNTTVVFLEGFGGGSGGAANYIGGGGGSVLIQKMVAVVPGTVYTITIGAGGAGGVGSVPATGKDGYSTTFGSLAEFIGAGFGGGTGGANIAKATQYDSGTSGAGGDSSTGSGNGNASLQGFAGGTGYPTATVTGGGGGGPNGVGANAGSGSGASAAANSGAGGAAGAWGGTTNNGGNGGSGQLTISWFA